MDLRETLGNDNRSCTAFVMYQPSYKSFMLDLLNGTISGANYSVNNFFQNNSEYLLKVYAYPIKLSSFVTIPSQSGDIGLGKLSCSYTSYETGYLKIVNLFSLNIPRIHNNFLDYEPYTTYNLYIPYFPIINLNPKQVYGYTIKGYLKLDIFTGKMCIYIENTRVNGGVTETNLLYSNTVSFGIPIPVGKTNAEEIQRTNVLNAISILGSLVATGVGLSKGDALISAGGIGALTKTVTKTLSDNVRHLTGYNGADGTRCEYSVDKKMKLIIETVQDVTVPDKALKGKPLKENYDLSDLIGYTEIGKINFNPKGEDIYDDEINEIVDLLRSGVIL